jgi:hypothetical protein
VDAVISRLSSARRIAMLAASALALAGCAEVTTWSTIERPDGRASAITEQSNGGATTSFGYSVYVQAKAQGASRSRVLNMDRGGPPAVTWREDGSLSLTVTCGDIYSFSNFVWIKVGGDFEKIPVSLYDGGPCPRR